MADILAETFSNSSRNEVVKVAYMCQERLVPRFVDIEFGISDKLMLLALSEASNKSSRHVEKLYDDHGDMGLGAKDLIVNEGELSIVDVYKSLYRIAETSGKGSQEQKINDLRSLFVQCSGIEAQYITRFVLGKLRLGVGEQTIIEALAHEELNRYISLSSNRRKDFFEEHIDLIDKDELIIKIKMKRVYLSSFVPKKPLPTIKKAKSLNIQDAHVRAFYNYWKPTYNYLRKIKDHFVRPIEKKFNLMPDLGRLAEILKSDGILGVNRIKITAGYPVRMALCERAKDSKDILTKMKKYMLKDNLNIKLHGLHENKHISGQLSELNASINAEVFFPKVAIEGKYDGIRLQIHKSDSGIDIFSRNLERMTDMFPEISKAISALNCNTVILDGESLAFNEETDELLPFQITMQRRRKHNIAVKASEFPLRYFVFDLLYLDGEDYTIRPYLERRKALENLIESDASNVIFPAHQFETFIPNQIDEFIEKSQALGLEGIIAKRLDAKYTAGARNFNWIKLKRSFHGELSDTIDVCIIGYYLGKGKRTQFGVGALLGAVYDSISGHFKSISKIGTGFTEDNLKKYFALLDEIKLNHKPNSVESDMVPDVWVEPKYVLTVSADEITRSQMHTAGRDENGIGYALRFPRATGLPREDKSAEDTTTIDEIINLANLQSNTPLEK